MVLHTDIMLLPPGIMVLQLQLDYGHLGTVSGKMNYQTELIGMVIGIVLQFMRIPCLREKWGEDSGISMEILGLKPDL